MRSQLTRLCAILGLMFILPALPAYAGGPGPFNAEIDCGGVFNPGDSVPWTVRIENQTLQSHPLNVTVSLNVPFIGTINLVNVNFTLSPNQDIVVNRALGLPPGAPAGQYQFTITASSPTFSTFDTCSFNVT